MTQMNSDERRGSTESWQDRIINQGKERGRNSREEERERAQQVDFMESKP